MAQTFEVAPAITAIDTEMAGQPGVTAAFLVHASEPALVETGPSTSAVAVERGLRRLGIDAGDLAHIVVTHIHLDHAGGAADLAERFPSATVWVHPDGAPHLIDPARLIASAERVYGPENLERMFGRPAPGPADRVRAVADGQAIRLGDRSLVVLHTPGHAAHHLSLFEPDAGTMFTGDSLGVLLPDVGVLRPSTPPPQFDLEQAVASLRRMQRARPATLLLTHFGPATDVDTLLEQGIEHLIQWTSFVREAMSLTDDVGVVARYLAERTEPDISGAIDRGIDPGRYDLLSSVRTNAAGIVRYLKRLQEPAP